MGREFLGCEVTHHLHIVKAQARDIVREALHSDTANLVGSVCVELLLRKNLGEVLHITLCCLRAACALLGVVKTEDSRVVLTYIIKACGTHKVTTLEELAVLRTFLE